MFGGNKRFIILFVLFCLFEPCLGVRYRNNDDQVVSTDIDEMFRENQITINFNSSLILKFYNFFYSLFGQPGIINHRSSRINLFAFDQFNPNNTVYFFPGQDWFEQTIRNDLVNCLVFEDIAEMNQYFDTIKGFVIGEYYGHEQPCSCPYCPGFSSRENGLSINQINFIIKRAANELDILEKIRIQGLGRVESANPPVLLLPVMPQTNQGSSSASARHRAARC